MEVQKIQPHGRRSRRFARTERRYLRGKPGGPEAWWSSPNRLRALLSRAIAAEAFKLAAKEVAVIVTQSITSSTTRIRQYPAGSSTRRAVGAGRSRNEEASPTSNRSRIGSSGHSPQPSQTGGQSYGRHRTRPDLSPSLFG